LGLKQENFWYQYCSNVNHANRQTQEKIKRIQPPDGNDCTIFRQTKPPLPVQTKGAQAAHADVNADVNADAKACGISQAK
jgi:hypothetical protein